MSDVDLPEWLTDRAPRAGRPGRRISPSEVVGWIVALGAGLAWGAAFKMTWNLIEVGSILPTLVVIAGPMVMLGYLLVRVLTGSFDRWTTGGGVALAAAGAILASSVVPGLSSSITVAGSLRGTINGASIEVGATCTWGPGRDRVIDITTGTVNVPSLPAGRIDIDLSGGSVSLQTTDPSGLGTGSMPLSDGPRAVEQASSAGDRSADGRIGAIAFDSDHGSVVAGGLAWVCQPVPGPDHGAASRETTA